MSVGLQGKLEQSFFMKKFSWIWEILSEIICLSLFHILLKQWPLEPKSHFYFVEKSKIQKFAKYNIFMIFALKWVKYVKNDLFYIIWDVTKAERNT